jgi:hypothetical protein
MPLTADIGTPQGTIRPIATPGSSTNVFEGLGRVANMFSDVMDESTRAKARAQAAEERVRDNARQDRAEARAVAGEERAAWTFGQTQAEAEAKDVAADIQRDINARTFANLQRPAETTYGPEVEQITIDGGTLGPEGEAATAKIEKVRKALVQGRVSQTVVDLQTRSIIDKYLTKNPDKSYELATALKQLGVDDPLVRSIKVFEDAAAQETAIRNETKKAYVKVAQDAGMTVVDDKGQIDTDKSAAIGQTLAQKQHEVKLAREALEMAVQQSGLNSAAAKDAQTKLENALLDGAYKSVDIGSNGIIMSLGNMFRAASMSNDPKQLSQLLQVSIPAARQSLQALRSRIIQEMGPNTPESVRKTALELVDKRIKDVDDFVSGDASAIKTKMAALDSFKVQFGLNNSEAFPVFSSLSGILGQSALLEMISGGNLTSLVTPEQMSDLRREIATGLATKGSRSATTTISNIALVVGGDRKLEDLTPGQQRDAIPGLMGQSRDTARTITTNGGGPQTWETFIRSTAGVTNAVVASALPSTMTHQSFKNAFAGVVGGADSRNRPLVAAAILDLSKRPGYDDEARALANASTIAGMKLLNTRERLIREASKGGLYNITFDEKNGTYSVVTDTKKLEVLQRRDRQLGGGFENQGFKRFSEVPSPKEAQELSGWLNGLVTHMSSLASITPEFDGANVTPLEAKLYYITGKTPKGLQAKGQEQASARKQFEVASAEFDKAITESTRMNLQERDAAIEASGRRAPAEVRSIIESAATKNGVDPDLMEALTYQESRFNTGAVSPKGARGLAQLMPGTAGDLKVDINNPEQNVEGGARYLATQLKRFGSIELALAAYNAGPEAVAKYKGIPPFKETQEYVKRVMAQYNAIRGS